MQQLRNEMAAFFESYFNGKARVLVYGEGSVSARVMLVGEAPGQQEEVQRRPFVGKAGKNLDEFLNVSGLKREDMYITNAVKLRPTRLSGAGRVVNRPPTAEEIKLFRPWLMREIALIEPEIIVTLGNVPLFSIMNEKLSIGAVHGQPLISAEGFRVFPMYHPASMIYNRSLREIYYEDMQTLAQRLKKDI